MFVWCVVCVAWCNICCISCVVCCALFAGGRLLCAVSCSLFVVCRLVVCCGMFVVCCTLRVARCLLCVVCWLMRDLGCSWLNLSCGVRRAVRVGRCSLFAGCCRLIEVWSVMYIVHCVLFVGAGCLVLAV